MPMLSNNKMITSVFCDPLVFTCLDDNDIGNLRSSSMMNKRKRKPAGTPDPEAEVVSLSPKTLMESDRFVCEICKQGFQREQNLQMHRRRHKVPWKLIKRENTAASRKRVFVCPEPTCLHYHPQHALGDLVGIKKHFRRKHSNHKQWACVKCSKSYAVQSDFKAHIKTCGTRGHSCDCGRVFSRVESFIEHQDTCRRMGYVQVELPPATTTTTSTVGNNLELQLLTTTTTSVSVSMSSLEEDHSYAEDVRSEARRQVEVAEKELSEAKNMRREAQAELRKAKMFRQGATTITCQACNSPFYPTTLL